MCKFSAKSEGVTFWGPPLNPLLASSTFTESHQKVTPSDFDKNLHTGVSEYAECNGGISSPSHMIVWPPEVKTVRSHQKVTPSDFHENMHTGVSWYAEFNGEISSPSHMILWPPEVKMVKVIEEGPSQNFMKICTQRFVDTLNTMVKSLRRHI